MIKSYALRQGRFTDAQKKAYSFLAEQYLIPFSDQKIDIQREFKKNDINNFSVTMEIGFGSGAATAEIAQVNPDNLYIGIEVHRPGIGRLLWEIEKRSLSNIRIIEYDAVSVAQQMIPNGSLDAVHIFFPDPWPKKKHRKRRLVQRPFTQVLCGCLKKGGYLYMVTDWEDYANHALEELGACEGLKNLYDGFALPQSWRPKTKFEEKGIKKGHGIWELFFVRN
ncbi:MAG: tRNA (guanosine(46)-N7)-methyltransferase TrmB [Treponema sp.]|nr:tRNA (guanosine(46)-N7)-methyltransferase TrmB [Treponema sp.]